MGKFARGILKKLKGEGEPLTTPGLLAISRRLGLSLADLELVTIGVIMDICVALSGDDVEDEIEADATQADYEDL